jgi:DNA-binding CsgD family transcriptional regulator
MRTPASPHPPVTLIGRERERAVLRYALDAALAGQGSLVLIGGEAGIGKTALAEALCRKAVEQGALVLVGRCYDLTETPPYGPWIDLFGRYRPADDLPALPAAFAERGTVGAVPSQAALMQQTLDFFTALTTTRSTVLLLDDLHWADPASLDLLRHLARNLPGLSLLLVVAYRADELTRRHPLSTLLPILVREASATRLTLHRLEPEETAALVRARFVLPPADADRLVAYLDARGEGNPFFIGEMLQTLIEGRILRPGVAGWTLGDLAGMQVPPLLRQVIDGRLARLGDEGQALLAVAAVIGQDVPFDGWMAVTGQGEATLLATIEQAIEAHLVDALADGTGFRFVHALIREALYESILPVRRRALHRQVGEALAAMPHPDPDAVAFHFRQSGDDRTAAWLIAAGERAQRAVASLTAMERYESALALLPPADAQMRGWLLYRIGRLHYGPQSRYLPYFTEALQIADAIGDRALAAAARFGRGLFRIGLGELRAGLEELSAGAQALEALSPADRARARELAVTASERDAPLGAVLSHAGQAGLYARVLALAEEWLLPATTTPDADPTSPIWAPAWAGLAITCIGLGRLAEARAALDRSRTGFERGGQYRSVGTTDMVRLRWLTLPYSADDLRERERLLANTVAAAERSRPDWGEGPVDWIAVGVHFVEGRWDDIGFAQMETVMRERLEYFQTRNHQPYLAWRYRERGERAEAWAQIHSVLPRGVATEPGDEVFLRAVAMQRVAAALALDEENVPLARAWLEAHDRWLAWNGAVLGQAEGQALWSHYFRQMGDRMQAYEHAGRALAHATEPRQPLALLAAHRLLGELATDAGRFDDAAHHLNTSLALADACAAPYERALTLLAFAELHAAKGNRADAHTALDEARPILERLGAKPALARADTLAARLTALVPSRPPSYPAGLTAREVEVLRLVAQGLSNADIAARLFVSERTIEQHLRSVYNKLGSSSRAVATRFAVEHGLT